MIARLGIFLAAALMLGSTAAAAPRSAATEFRLDEPFAHKSLQINNLNGPVEVTRASGNELHVTAVRTAERSDPNSVTIKVTHDGEGIVICAVYPGQDDNCTRRGGSHYNNHRENGNNDTTVAFTVALPAGSPGAFRVVNGSVDARDLASAVDAMTVNGHINISTTSYAQARTVNGAIHVSMGSADWPVKSLEFASVNGAIDVIVPNATSARVHMKTLNGSIHSNVALNHHEGIFGITRAAEGVIGSGRNDLSFTTVNGSISLQKSP